MAVGKGTHWAAEVSWKLRHRAEERPLLSGLSEALTQGLPTQLHSLPGDRRVRDPDVLSCFPPCQALLLAVGLPGSAEEASLPDLSEGAM